MTAAEQLFVGAFFAACISFFSYVARLLTAGGSLAQFILGTILLGFGGWQWTLPMVVFFLLSSLISKVGTQRRAQAAAHFEKSSRRDAWQVLANGGAAGIMTLVWFFTHEEALYVAYLGAVAAATADTWGTEIGTLSNKSPLLLTTFTRVDAGRSGAVSMLGILAGVLGSCVIWGTALFWISASSLAMFLSVIIGGLAGTVADSLLGATLQVQYQCSVCRRITELREHCGNPALWFRGIAWIDNDIVNFIATLVGGFASLAASKII